MTLLYRYRAARGDGGMVSGTVEGGTAAQATALLLDRGLHPIVLEPSLAEGHARRPASRRDLAIVFRSLAALVSAGVPLDRALESSEILVAGPLREVLAEARRRLREGQGLARALDSAHGTVPPVVLGLLRAGDRGGHLEASLEEAAVHLESEAELLGRIRQALAYPAMLATAGTLSVVVIGTVVLPRFAQLLGDLGQELPATTRIVLAGSTMLHAHGVLVLAILGAGIVACSRWARTPRGRLRWHRVLLELPVIGPVRAGLATARLSRALGGMLRSGMPLLQALAAAGDAAGDAAVAERLDRARERVARGEPLASSIQRERAMSGHAIQLIAVGESSGRLAAMAGRAGDLAAGEAERRMAAAVTLLEPAMILLFGGGVALVAAGLLQAVYSLRPGMP